jgi:hypothetical protein
VMQPTVNEEPAKDDAAEQKYGLHGRCPFVREIKTHRSIPTRAAGWLCAATIRWKAGEIARPWQLPVTVFCRA